MFTLPAAVLNHRNPDRVCSNTSPLSALSSGTIRGTPNCYDGIYLVVCRDSKSESPSLPPVPSSMVEPHKSIVGIDTDNQYGHMASDLGIYPLTEWRRVHIFSTDGIPLIDLMWSLGLSPIVKWETP